MLLAHQGGWDEFLLVAGPIIVIIGVLAVAKRRVDRAAATPAEGDGGGQPTPDPSASARS